MALFMDAALIVFIFLYRRGKILKDDDLLQRKWLRTISMGEEESDRVIAKQEKQKSLFLNLILVCCLLSAVVFCYQMTGRKNLVSLLRPESGSGSVRYELEAEGEGNLSEEVTLEVSERLLSEEECAAYIAEKFEELKEEILSENDSLSEIRSDLALPSDFQGLSITWISDSPAILGSQGEILTEEVSEEGSLVTLRALLSFQGYEEEKTVTLTIFPQEQTEEESEKEKLGRFLSEAEENQREEAEFLLPEEFDGQQIKYYAKTGNPAMRLCLIALLATVVLIIYYRNAPEELQKEKSEQLKEDYVELILRLTIYIRAGMSIRGAFFRISEEYRDRRKNGEKMHYVYEEITLTCCKIESGIAEGSAYAEFGRLCELQSYIRLGSLLEQNVRKGGGELLHLLEEEASEAFEEQKNLARKKGEETETKMLLPMGMMLAVIMVILIIPMFSGFSLW